MSDSFFRTRNTLGADSSRRPLRIASAALAAAAAWAGWLALAEVPVYETTATARLESGRAAHVVQAPIDGRIAAVHLTLGRKVNAGDVLAEVESDAEQWQLTEQSARVASLDPQIASLKSEIALVERNAEEEWRATAAALEVAKSQAREADAPARYAEEDAARLQKLRDHGLIAEREYQRGRTEAAKHRAAATSQTLVIERIESEQRVREGERNARLERLRNELGQLIGEAGAARAGAERLRYEIRRRTIRAAVAGELGDIAALRPGSFVRQGDRLASIIPAGEIRVVAWFAPGAAAGRIVAGQRARVRLDGFNWVEHGAIDARVERVARESQDLRVRVELRPDLSRTGSIPAQHGLPGSVEVEVERISPATLVARAAGRLLAAPRPTVTVQASAREFGQ